jgi:hypothetical protein
MALSDREQKLLEQMEQALASEDPKLATTLRAPSIRLRAPKNLVFAILAVVIGVTGLLAGVVTQLPPIGILGFVSIVAGLSIAFSGATAVVAKTTKTSAGKNKSSFMQGFEERWDRRNNGL